MSRCISRCRRSIVPVEISYVSALQRLWGCDVTPTHIVASLWLPQADVFRSKSDNVALVVHDTGTSTASAHINTNVVLDMRMKLISRVSRQLSRRLPVGLTERDLGHCECVRRKFRSGTRSIEQLSSTKGSSRDSLFNRKLSSDRQADS